MGCLIILIAVIISMHKLTLTLKATQVICKIIFIIKIHSSMEYSFYVDLCRISSITKVVVLVFYANFLVTDTSDLNH